MSVGVLVVEAGEYSGTRITSRCALEQNRDVFAVPGNVTSKGSWVPNSLIKQGAKLTATWEDVWEELPTEVRLQLEQALGEATETQGLLPGLESAGTEGASILSSAEGLPDSQRLVLEELRVDESTQLDELIERLDGRLGSAEIFTALFELEIAGRVRQLPGKNYVRAL
jgi:DNA processing protein